MSTIEEMTEKEYNEVTLNILDRTKLLKTQIIRNNTIGESSIIAGIELFETVFKELNIDSIDDETVEFVEKSIEELLLQIEEKNQIVSQCMHYGINCCYTILEGYNKRIKHENSYLRKRT